MATTKSEYISRIKKINLSEIPILPPGEVVKEEWRSYEEAGLTVIMWYETYGNYFYAIALGFGRDFPNPPTSVNQIDFLEVDPSGWPSYPSSIPDAVANSSLSALSKYYVTISKYLPYILGGAGLLLILLGVMKE